MVFTVRSGRCKSLPSDDKALVCHDYPEKPAETSSANKSTLVPAQPSLRSQQFKNHVGLYHYDHWPELQNTTFFTYFFGEKHSHCVVLTQTCDNDTVHCENDTVHIWVLYEGADETEGREAFDQINRTLAPLLSEGAVVLSEDLLDAVITPEPIPPEDIPDIVLELIEVNPDGHPEWALVVKALLLSEENTEEVSSIDAVTPVNEDTKSAGNLGDKSAPLKKLSNIISPAGNVGGGIPTPLQRLSSMISNVDSNDDVFYSLKSPHSLPELVNLHDAVKENKPESIRKVMVRKATQSALFEELDSVESTTQTSLDRTGSFSSFDPVDLDPVDRISQDTPLYSSVEKGYIKSSLYFLLGGANPSFVHPESGNTCLHLAAKQGSTKMIKLLLTFNADPSVKNKEGVTPLDILKDGDSCLEILSTLEEVVQLRKQNKSLPFDLTNGSASLIEGQYLLSFDGGGSRCVTAMQTLITVEKRMQKLNPNCKPLVSYFDYMAGTSGGSFLTTMLVYNRNTLENARALSINGSTLLTGSSIYEKTRGVEKLIKSTLGSERVMTDVPYPRCILTATLANTIPPKLHLLTNYGEARNGQLPPQEQTVWEATRMSSAAPTYLLSHKNVIDGGVMANNPTVDAIVEMNEQAKKDTGKPLKLGCVLSLGCGVEKPVNVDNIDVSGYSFGIKGLANKVDGYKNLISLMISSVTQTEGRDLSRAQALCDLSGGVYYRLTPPVDEAIPLDTNNPVELIQPLFDSFIYTLRNPGLIDKVARTILSKADMH